MKNKIMILLVGLTFLSILTACGSNTQNNISEENNEVKYDDNTVNVKQSQTDEVDSAVEEEEQPNTTLWSSMNLDISYTKRKCIVAENDTFESDFVSQYVDYIPIPQVLVDISGQTMKEYRLDDTRIVYVFENNSEEEKTVTCVYYDQKDSLPFEKTQLDLIGYFPQKDDSDYKFTTEDNADATIVTYTNITGELTDNGTKYYDSSGRLVLWNHYVTSGCRQMFIVWKDDKVSLVVDTGGMAYGTDSEDADVSIGIGTSIYHFENPISFENLIF